MTVQQDIGAQPAVGRMQAVVSFACRHERAILAGLMTQAGVLTSLSGGGGTSDQYVYVTSGLLLIVVAVAAPEGLTGIAQRGLARGAEMVRSLRPMGTPS